MTPYYDHAGITLYHADSRQLLPELSGPVALVLTDPPYGIALANHDATGQHRRPADWTIAGDGNQQLGSEILAFAQAKGWPTIAFASPRMPWPGEWKQFLVWNKGGHVGGGGDPSTCWKPTWELIQVTRTGKLNGKRDGAVLRYPADKRDYHFHPTPKPVALMAYLIGKATQPGELVLDPFAGAVSTLLAAREMGRKAIGVEIDERHCETTVRRLAQELIPFPAEVPSAA
jgi:site-specific DNA-methyltransferase (adenine-specific)